MCRIIIHSKGAVAITVLAVALCLTLTFCLHKSTFASQAAEADIISISGTPFYKSVNGSLLGGDSFIENATIAGVGSVQNIGTYKETALSPNFTQGTGQGLMVSGESGNTISWNAYDLGQRQSDGTYEYTGIIFFSISPLQSVGVNDDGASGNGNNEFSFLDNKAGIYRSLVDSNDSTRQIWLLQ
jgi:hypothetical protein